MKMEQIESFLKAAKYLNITKAADDLYISQSTVSRQIAALEAEIGHPLFFRLKKSLQLTAVGATMLEEFTQIYDQYQQAVSKLHTDAEEVAGTLRIGFLSGTEFPETILEPLAQFSEQFPQVCIDCIQCEMPELVEQLSEYQVDLAVLPQVVSYGNNDLLYQRISSEPPRLVVPEDIQAEWFSPEFFHQLEGLPIYTVSEVKYPYLYIAGKEVCEQIPGSKLQMLDNISSLRFRLSLSRCVGVVGPDFAPVGSPKVKSIALNPERALNQTVTWKKGNHNNSLMLALEYLCQPEQAGCAV